MKNTITRAALAAIAAAWAIPSLASAEPAATWGNSVIYFLMTDRFSNGDPKNDGAYGRVKDGDPQRSFEGGDLRGVIQKLDEGYFNALGVTALWTTPIIEQVHQPFEEYGRSYAFHGYWPLDWTNVDAAFGTEADFSELVDHAHRRDIRVIVDVIMNHAGPPIGGNDPAWPADWVRTEPACDYASYAGTASCLIVPALQDVRTDRDTPVELPPFLIEKWRAEGRLDQEVAELDAFFSRTGYPRTPRYYIIKWLTDWVREYGVDGFRVDTAKHVDPLAWYELRVEAQKALEEWRAKHPDRISDDRPFYMVGEVFNFGADNFQKAVGTTYNYGDRRVDFYDYGFDSLINMGFATHAREETPDLFRQYADAFEGVFKGHQLLNYISSHDDQEPLDPERKTPFEDAFKLMMAPGSVQIYYGDEISRPLVAPGTTGDARLRTSMDWSATSTPAGSDILSHWQRLGTFRSRHPAVGSGKHVELSRAPYVFSRILDGGPAADRIVAAYAPAAPYTAVPSGGVFPPGSAIHDAYAGDFCSVTDSQIVCPTPRTISLFEAAASQ